GVEMTIATDKLAAFEAVVTPIVASTFADYKLNYSVVAAAKMAYRDKYIADAFAQDPTLEATVMQDANNEYGTYWSDAEQYWKEKWSWDESDYVPTGTSLLTYKGVIYSFFGNTAVKNAVLAMFGLSGDMSAYGIDQLARMLDNSGEKLSYYTVVERYSAILLSNYFESQNYHKVNGTDPLPAFVNKYVNEYMDGKLSEWRGYSDSERLSRLTDMYRWEYTMNSASRFGGTRVAIYEGAMNMYLALTNQTMADIFTIVNGMLYQLEVNTWIDGSESREIKTDYSEHKVVGFFMTENTEGDEMVISDTVYEEFTTWKSEQDKNMNGDMFTPDYTEERVEHTPGSYAFALAAISAGDAAAIQKLVELSYSDEHTTDFLFEMQNAVMYTLGNFNEIIEVLAQVFVWVGLGLALFSALLLMNFISTSISYKKREIGILRAVGARSSDVFKIFFSEAFIIALINFLMAVAASVAAVLVLNYYMRNSGINITLLSFGAVQVAIMLGVSIVVAALASFLPVNGIARKKPVDAIKDR
ncbi:MAG: ABC transporter permease, partial [Clostridia bacterium]|nr:ABC transporter permease [Clostridia bacterium]